MMPRILFLLADYPLAPLNHKKRRLDRLFGYLSGKGISLYITLPHEDSDDTLNASHFPACTLLPWDGQPLTADTYSTIVIDGELPPASLPALPENCVRLAAAGQEDTGNPNLTFLPTNKAHSALLPLEATCDESTAKASNFGTAHPGMLVCTEANEANLGAVQAFCTDVWPAIHEMCPNLVARLPEEFLALGVATAPGIEWIKVPNEDYISHHIRQALMALIPAISPEQMINQHADYAKHAVPCLSARAFLPDNPPPLVYRSPEEAALQAYRLMSDAGFHGAQAKRIHEFGMTNYSRTQIFEPLDRLLVKEGGLDG